MMSLTIPQIPNQLETAKTKQCWSCKYGDPHSFWWKYWVCLNGSHKQIVSSDTCKMWRDKKV